jgi:phosphatidylinositol kinase/protein kinase (PI-3  family)
LTSAVCNPFYNFRRVGFDLASVGYFLNDIVRECAIPYLDDDHAGVRRSAGLTCCRCLAVDPITIQGSSKAIVVIADVLDKLLAVGIADRGMQYLLVFPTGFDCSVMP